MHFARWFVVVVVGLGLNSGSLRADEREQALAIIAKAMRAAGGEDKLAKTKSGVMTCQGKISAMGLTIPFDLEASFVSPAQSRSEIDIDVSGMKIKVINVLNGDKGWTSNAGNVAALDGDQLKEAQEQAHGRWVEMLAPLKDKAFTLSLAGEAQVDGRPAVGIRVGHPDRRDVTLFFDKENHFHVKTETRAKHPFTMQEALQETIYSDFKEINGLQLATRFKIFMDKEPLMECENVVLKLVDKHPAGHFDELK